MGLGGCLGDGDVDAKGLDLAEVSADLAVAVGCALVPVGAEVGESGFGAGEQVQGLEYVTGVQWLNDMFNGVALILAVAFALLAARCCRTPRSTAAAG